MCSIEQVAVFQPAGFGSLVSGFFMVVIDRFVTTRQGIEFLKQCDKTLNHADIQHWLKEDEKLREQYGERYILVIFQPCGLQFNYFIYDRIQT